jgi:hypothetical protein
VGKKKVLTAPGTCVVCGAELGVNQLGVVSVCDACKAAAKNPGKAARILTNIYNQHINNLEVFMAVNAPLPVVEQTDRARVQIGKRLDYALAVN